LAAAATLVSVTKTLCERPTHDEDEYVTAPQQSSGSIEFYELKFRATSKALFHRNHPSFLHNLHDPETAAGGLVK
jgi:hypothetical protein